MFDRIRQIVRGGEDGQSLVLLAFALVVVMGAAGMSIDVGRAYWARTQMQNAVDAAALAAAQSLPDTTAATTQANTYWDLNNNFLEANASNIVFTPTYNLTSTKEVTVSATAEVDTWFAKVLGIDHWDVAADATAEFQQVDAMLVLDRSGSMCYDSHGPQGNYIGLVRINDGNLSSSTSTSIPNTDAANATRQISVLKHSSVTSASLSDLLWVGQKFQFNSTTEWMQIVSIDSSTLITIRRGVSNPNSSSTSATSRVSHATGQYIQGDTCPQAGKGPYLPWQYVKNGATVFVNNMNSTYDQIGYANFATVGVLNTDFTFGFTTLKSTIAGTYDPGVMGSSNLNGDSDNHFTNISHGLWFGINQHLNSSNKRAGASKVIVLLSDGVANRYCSASSPSAMTTSCSLQTDAATAEQRTLDVAQYAKQNNIKVYTISYGAGADTALMEDVADITGGKHYIAPDEATLNSAFSAIAKSTHVKLTK